MMSSWPIDDDGAVSIPHEETMLLRSAFDLFDADKSGALDYSEVKTCMRTIPCLESSEIFRTLQRFDSQRSRCGQRWSLAG
jgi:Ca2+-binding EF-hand superfamily protein